MRIAARCSNEIKNLWLKKIEPDVKFDFVETENDFLQADADMYIDLLYPDNGSAIALQHKPLFVHAVITTLAELPESCIRLNGWNGFMENETIELVASEKNLEAADMLMHALHYQYKQVPDLPGMIAPRIISMIINEAYYALEDKVSTKEEIDIAMRLGTNYPMGPFEWGKKIGLKNIYALLAKLNSIDSRYTVASLLKHEAEMN